MAALNNHNHRMLSEVLENKIYFFNASVSVRLLQGTWQNPRASRPTNKASLAGKERSPEQDQAHADRWLGKSGERRGERAGRGVVLVMSCDQTHYSWMCFCIGTLGCSWRWSRCNPTLNSSANVLPEIRHRTLWRLQWWIIYSRWPS